MSKPFNLQRFNDILALHAQQLRAESITGQVIVLSNGKVLSTKTDVRLCKRRVMDGHFLWKSKFDEIYGFDDNKSKAAISYIKSTLSSIGGKACQTANGELIRQNLNTGVPWNKGMKGVYPYSTPCSESAKEKISKANAGKNNGMYGYKWSAEHKARQSNHMKQKILEGKFTPNSNNRNTHWESTFNGKIYRSSWEAMYQSIDRDAEYETLRIFYDYEGKERVYIVDFVNHASKTVVEVKPKELMNNSKVQAKINALHMWCSANKYNLLCVDISWLLNYQFDLTEFDCKTARKIQNYETSKKNRN